MYPDYTRRLFSWGKRERERERERERTKPNQTKPKHTTLVKGRGGELLSNESANLFENLNHHLKIYGQSWNPPSFLP